MTGAAKYAKAWVITTLATRALLALTVAGAGVGVLLGDGVTFTIQIKPGG